MNDEQLKETLRALASYVVRNEIVCEHFLTQKLPVSGDEIGAKVREVDKHLHENTQWQSRFPGLFEK
jgi:Mn-dependent DtxR family transcriptional regulator